MSLLAHIVGNDEPTATKALAYILRSSPDIAQAFVQVLDLPAFTPGRIVSELTHDDARPDITIDDADGVTRAFVENKFWAGLTPQQPVVYLNALPEDRSAALLFIVPEQRIPTVWSELRKRCREAGLALTDESSRRVRIGPRFMLVTSWNHVLELLRNAAAAGGHNAIEQDVTQLRGLTDRVDSDAFLPLRPDEITEVGTAQRLINYSDLVESIADRLVEKGIADKRDRNGRLLKSAHSWYTAGRYLLVHSKFGLWLGVELKVWRDSGITPLWWRVQNTDFHSVGPMWTQIERRFEDVQVYEDEGCKYIPIRLKTGVEKDMVIDHAVAQMTDIADTFLALMEE